MIRYPVFLLAAGVALAGCGSGGNDLTPLNNTPAAAVETTTTTGPPTTTTVPATTTTACVPADTTADQTYLDALQASIRQTEGAVAQIELVIGNSGRDLDSARRHRDSVQADYDEAVRAAEALGGWDTAMEEVAYQEGRLADANGSVASWEAIVAKAQGDLGRAQAQLDDFRTKEQQVTARLAAAPTC